MTIGSLTDDGHAAVTRYWSVTSTHQNGMFYTVKRKRKVICMFKQKKKLLTNTSSQPLQWNLQILPHEPVTEDREKFNPVSAAEALEEEVSFSHTDTVLGHRPPDGTDRTEGILGNRVKEQSQLLCSFRGTCTDWSLLFITGTSRLPANAKTLEQERITNANIYWCINVCHHRRTKGCSLTDMFHVSGS